MLAERHATLNDIIAGAEQKFGADFNSRLFLEQLVYLDALTDTDVRFIKPEVTPRDIQGFFDGRVRELGDTLSA